MSRISIEGTTHTVPSGLLIGGKWVQGRGSALESVNPDTEEVIASVSCLGRDGHRQVTDAQIPTASKEDVDDAVKAARQTFETTWGIQVSSQQRGQLLFALADAMAAIQEELAIVESLDSGKPLACECSL